MKTNRSWIWYSLVIIGVFARLRHFFFNRSLEHDEAHLVGNILSRSFSQLLQPLDGNQAAPICFLEVEKFMTLLFGDGELTLRAFPLVAGILAIFLFSKLASAFFKHMYFLIAIAFFVFCDPAIYYSAMVKQYSIDLCASLLLWVLSIPLFFRKENQNILLYCLLASAIIWFSQPSIFVITSIFTLWVVKAIKEKKVAILHLIFFCLPFLSFTMSYFLFLSNTITSDSLQDYHASYFMPVEFWTLDAWSWYADHFFRLFRMPGGILFKYGAGLLWIFGLFSIIKARSYFGWSLILPIIFAFICSALGLYSTMGRLMIFAIPGLLIPVVMGAKYLAGLMPVSLRWKKIFSLLILFLLLLQPVLDFVHHVVKPKQVSEVRETMSYIAENIKENEPIYIYPYGLAQYRYYEKKIGLDAYRNTVGVSPYEDWKSDTRLHTKKGRSWFIFTHHKRSEGVYDADMYRSFFTERGSIEKELKVAGSHCFLVDFNLQNIE